MSCGADVDWRSADWLDNGAPGGGPTWAMFDPRLHALHADADAGAGRLNQIRNVSSIIILTDLAKPRSFGNCTDGERAKMSVREPVAV